MAIHSKFEFDYTLLLYPRLRSIAVHWSNTLLNKGFIDGLANGPYGDTETPVRNTCHALTALSKAYNYYEDCQFKAGAKSALDYLFSTEARPCDAAFICRLNPHKDFSNGLVGQAFVIESLLAAFNSFKVQRCLDTAINLYQQHFWDDEFCLWRRLSVDGSYLPFDFTLNHQIWFASESSYLPANVSSIHVKKFLDHLESKITIYPDGCIFHNSYVNYSLSDSQFKHNSKRAVSFYKFITKSKMLRSKSVGYHCFNLYAFARLYSFSRPFFLAIKYLKSIQSFDHVNTFTVIHRLSYMDCITILQP